MPVAQPFDNTDGVRRNERPRTDPSEPPSDRLTSPDPHESHASRAQLTLLSEAADHRSSPFASASHAASERWLLHYNHACLAAHPAAHKYSSSPAGSCRHRQRQEKGPSGPSSAPLTPDVGISRDRQPSSLQERLGLPFDRSES